MSAEHLPAVISFAAAATSRSPPQEQIITPITEPIFQAPPATVSTPRFYEKFVVKAFQTSPEVHLDCSRHPFFNGIPNTPQDQRDFFDKDLAKVETFLKGA